MAGYEHRNRGDKEGEQLRKLFIGGLTPNVTDDDLKQHFGQWGEIVDVVVMKDKVSGRSRGFGFITYRDDSSVDDAQANRPHVLDNKEADTKRAMPRGESASGESHVRVEKLFIGGLKPDTTEDEIRDYFSSYGEVVGAEIAKMRETGKPRGFAFVTFKDYDPVDKAILYKPHNIGSSERVDCKKALSKEQMAEVKARQQAAPYGGRGGFAGGRGGGGYGGGGGSGYGAGGYGSGGGYGASAGGYGGGYGSDAYGNGSYAGGYADGGYGGGYGDSAGYGGGGYAGGAGYSEGGEGSYGNGAGFGSYDSQGYSGGPAKSMGGFGGGPQRFQPYSGGRGRGGGGGGFRGGRGGGRGGY